MNTIGNKFQLLILSSAIISLGLFVGCDQPPRTKVVGGLNFIYIPAGNFTMGCIKGDTLCWEEELPQRTIALEQGFFMSQTEVTVSAFRHFLERCDYTPESIIKNQGRIFQNELDDWKWTTGVSWEHPLMEGLPVPDNFPVAQVSWKDADEYCTCMGGRLPTEIEWEYAARGGQNNNLYPWGDNPTPLIDGIAQSNGPDSTTEALYSKMAVFPDYYDGYATYAPVASFPPNGFDLYDMAGNVREWCADDFYYRAYQYPVGELPPDSLRRKSKIVRGGSWAYAPSQQRLSERGAFEADGFWTASLGFRCVLDSKI